MPNLLPFKKHGDGNAVSSTTTAPQLPDHVFDFLAKLFVAFPGNVPQGAIDRMEVFAVYGAELEEFSPEVLLEAYRRFIKPDFHKHAPFRPDLPRVIGVCQRVIYDAGRAREHAEWKAEQERREEELRKRREAREAFLRTPEGQAELARERAETERLWAEHRARQSAEDRLLTRARKNGKVITQRDISKAEIDAEIVRHEREQAELRAKREADEAYLRTPEGQAELARCADLDYQMYLAKRPTQPMSRKEFEDFSWAVAPI